MSDIPTALSAASSTSAAAPEGRNLLGWLAAPFIALWKGWSIPDNMLDLSQVSQQELADMGASPEVLAEAQALREFELSRAYALTFYYW